MNVRRNNETDLECDTVDLGPAAMRDVFSLRTAVLYLGTTLVAIVGAPYLLEVLYVARGIPPEQQRPTSEGLLILAGAIAGTLGTLLVGKMNGDNEAAALRANLTQSEARHGAELAALREQVRNTINAVTRVPPPPAQMPPDPAAVVPNIPAPVAPAPAPVVPAPVVPVPAPIVPPIVEPEPVAPVIVAPAPVVVNVNGRDLVDDEVG